MALTQYCGDARLTDGGVVCTGASAVHPPRLDRGGRRVDDGDGDVQFVLPAFGLGGVIGERVTHGRKSRRPHLRENPEARNATRCRIVTMTLLILMELFRLIPPPAILRHQAAEFPRAAVAPAVATGRREGAQRHQRCSDAEAFVAGTVSHVSYPGLARYYAFHWARSYRRPGWLDNPLPRRDK